MYRVSVKPDGSTEVTVRSGDAEIFTPKGSEDLPAGKTMLREGTSPDPEFQVSGAIPLDDFDRWNEARDQDLRAFDERSLYEPRYRRRRRAGHQWALGV